MLVGTVPSYLEGFVPFALEYALNAGDLYLAIDNRDTYGTIRWYVETAGEYVYGPVLGGVLVDMLDSAYISLMQPRVIPPV